MLIVRAILHIAWNFRLQKIWIPSKCFTCRRFIKKKSKFSSSNSWLKKISPAKPVTKSQPQSHPCRFGQGKPFRLSLACVWLNTEVQHSHCIPSACIFTHFHLNIWHHIFPKIHLHSQTILRAASWDLDEEGGVVYRQKKRRYTTPPWWGLCEYVKLPPSPVILWIELGGKLKWLPLIFGHHAEMRTGPICIGIHWKHWYSFVFSHWKFTSVVSRTTAIAFRSIIGGQRVSCTRRNCLVPDEEQLMLEMSRKNL